MGTASGGFRLVKLEGLKVVPQRRGVRGRGVEFETGGLTLNWGANPLLAPS